jgi:signal transduction histidine kinase
MWFGATILLTTALIAAVMILSNAPAAGAYRNEWVRARTFISNELERVWDRPAERDALAERFSKELDLQVVLRDKEDHAIATFGPNCHMKHPMRLEIERDGQVIGSAEACTDNFPRSHFHVVLPIVIIAFMLWGASGKIARRLSRPLSELVRVTGDIGAGKLESRAEIGLWIPDEMAVLGESINDMATRIQRQLEDQRALLAAVSHELRTPLGHLRLLLELAKGAGTDPKTAEEIEKEIVEIDSLVGELLASSRLDFTAINPRPLDAIEVGERALERAGLPKERLKVEGAGTGFEADPTLIARAIANLLENAKKHGGGATELRVRANPETIAFEVDDGGGGFLEGETERVFEPFYKRPQELEKESGPLGLGLGLSLVRRIAEAHGGRAYASNRGEGGARVGFEIARSRSS